MLLINMAFSSKIQLCLLHVGRQNHKQTVHYPGKYLLYQMVSEKEIHISVLKVIISIYIAYLENTQAELTTHKSRTHKSQKEITGGLAVYNDHNIRFPYVFSLKLLQICIHTL